MKIQSTTALNENSFININPTRITVKSVRITILTWQRLKMAKVQYMSLIFY